MNNITYIPLELGMIGTIQGKSYTIVGRVRWKSYYKEYYEGENKRGYSWQYWIYDEWILKDREEDIIYLCEDKEGFTIAREVQVDHRPGLKRDKIFHTKFFKHHPLSRITEYGESTLLVKEGEVENELDVKQKKLFFQYEYADSFFTQEVKEPFAKSHREHYQEDKISRKKVLKAFQKYPKINTCIKNLKTLSLAAISFEAATLVFLVMFVMSFYTKKTILTHQIKVLYGISPDSALTVPPWKIDRKNQLYLLEMKYVFPSNPENSLTESFVSAYVYEEGKGIVSELLGDFYYEYGYDSDGRWTESQTSAYKFLRSDQNADYFAELYIEQRFPASGWLTFQVKERWFPWYYTLTALLIGLSVALLLEYILWRYTV